MGGDYDAGNAHICSDCRDYLCAEQFKLYFFGHAVQHLSYINHYLINTLLRIIAVNIIISASAGLISLIAFLQLANHRSLVGNHKTICCHSQRQFLSFLQCHRKIRGIFALNICRIICAIVNGRRQIITACKVLILVGIYTGRDGYITVPDVKLTINVVSPFQVNDEIVMATAESNPVIELTQGEAAEILIDSEPFAYQAMLSQGQITNWYTKSDAKYLRDEEKTHADGTTIPYDEVEEKHELNYSVEGTLPEGITAEVQTGTAYGLRTNKAFEIVTGLKLSGTATAPGEYEVTVRENVPYCRALAGIWLLPTDELTVEQNFTIIVK